MTEFSELGLSAPTLAAVAETGYTTATPIQAEAIPIALAGQEAGMSVLGYTSQAHFLINCGLVELLAAADLPTRSRAHKLIQEHEMGELFKVIGFAAAGSPAFEALGFAGGDRSHTL